MNHTIKRIGSLFLVFVLLMSTSSVSMAKDEKEPSILYYSNEVKKEYECECLDEAMMHCNAHGGGQIVLCEDREFNIPGSFAYSPIGENVTFVVRDGATLTIGKNGLRLDGKLVVIGTVDLENSEGIIYGDGEIVVVDGGKMIKKNYTVNKMQSDVCLKAKGINYGQSLQDAEIVADGINWRTSVGGSWEFVEPEQKPQSGTNLYDVVFKPKYPMTYEEQIFERSGEVTVKKVAPKRKEYETVEIYAGQNLLEADAGVKYVSPVTGEEVKGNFSFEQAEQPVSGLGEIEKKGTFTPFDDNYEAVTDVFRINVKETEPEILKKPQIRGQGIYGQTLSEIAFIPGRCVNPHTGQTIEGVWEWKDGSERLQPGTGSYVMMFLPSDDGYAVKETEIDVTTNPKVMEDIEWPSCSDISYGDSLADSELSFVKNEYGTFSWKNENVRPGVKNSGVQVVFYPTHTDVYDWSKLAGYDRQSKTITFSIPIRVRTVSKKLPQIKAADIEEGSCVSGSALILEEKEGTAEWKEPECVAEMSGDYPVYFTPYDTENYDWSSYNPDEQGRVVMQVHVNVIKKKTSIPSGQEGGSAQNEGSVQVENVKQSGSRSQETSSETSDGERATFVITQMVSKVPGTEAIAVKTTKILKCKRKGTHIKLSWKKVKGAYYQIQYTTNGKWKNLKKKTVKGTSVVLKKLSKKKKYNIRIRCIKKKDGIKYYSKWVKKKRV